MVDTVRPPQSPQSATLVLSDGYEVYTAATLSGASTTAVYTAATAAEKRISRVDKIVITNPTAGSLNVTILYYNAASTTAHEWYPLQALASKARVEFNDVKMLLSASDELRVTESGSGISVFVTTREFQGNRT